MDGSTSARALIQMSAYQLLGVRYKWSNTFLSIESTGEWHIAPAVEDIPARYRDRFKGITTSNTHEAFVNLIDGNEEIFRTLVMDGLQPAEFPEAIINGMVITFGVVKGIRDGFCYTFDNYKEMIVRMPDSEVPKIAVNGVFPDERSVRDGSYPFISEVHVAIRSDLDRSSMAYKLYEWLLSENAERTISECGFLHK